LIRAPSVDDRRPSHRSGSWTPRVGWRLTGHNVSAEVTVRFEVLGPVRVLDGSRPVGPGSAMRRRLLAVLLARAKRAGGPDLLVGVLWGPDLPERPGVSLHFRGHRRRQGPARRERLAATPGGFLLNVEPGELDSEEFDDLAAQARRAREANGLVA